MSMNAEESKGFIGFPESGVYAQNVPQDTVEFKLSSGAVKAKDENFFQDLDQELNDSFQAVRSMMIFVEAPAEVQGIYDNPIHIQAGWTPLEDLPDVDEFKMDFEKLNREMTPGDVQVQVLMFNTENLPLPDGTKKVAVSKEKKTSVGTASYETIMAIPTVAYRDAAFTVHNDGSNPAQIKLTSITAGNTFPEEIDTDSTPVTRELEAGEYGRIEVNSPTQFLKLEAQSSNGSTEIRTEFNGVN